MVNTFFGPGGPTCTVAGGHRTEQYQSRCLSLSWERGHDTRLRGTVSGTEHLALETAGAGQPTMSTLPCWAIQRAMS